jgi:hypothetical protein
MIALVWILLAACVVFLGRLADSRIITGFGAVMVLMTPLFAG